VASFEFVILGCVDEKIAVAESEGKASLLHMTCLHAYMHACMHAFVHGQLLPASQVACIYAYIHKWAFHDPGANMTHSLRSSR
jgi:hypothetical protein